MNLQKKYNVEPKVTEAGITRHTETQSSTAKERPEVKHRGCLPTRHSVSNQNEGASAFKDKKRSYFGAESRPASRAQEPRCLGCPVSVESVTSGPESCVDIRLPPPQEVSQEFQRQVSKDLLDDEQILKAYEAKSKQALIKDQMSLVQQETCGLNDTIDEREVPCNFKNENQENLLIMEEEPDLENIEVI